MDILYSDKDIIACIKPVGMDAEHEVPEALKAEFGGEIFTVHRLDLNVGLFLNLLQQIFFAE